jgi:RNA polymerase sigma-70 factor (ECF subfamily)
MLRKRQRQRSVPLDDDAWAGLVSEQGEEPVGDILEPLSPEQRTIVALYYLEGYRVREIAKMLDIPAGTVKSRLTRARVCLREEAGIRTEVHGGMLYERA